MILFFALVFFAVAIAGATAFVIFWPLALVHLRDRHPTAGRELGPVPFLNPRALGWLLAGRYRVHGDRNLDGLATPARVSLIAIISGLALSGLMWLLSTMVA